MNKIILYSLMMMFLMCCAYPLKAELETTIELRSAAFFHSSKRFREIYGRVGASYGFEVSTRYRNCLAIWVNYDQFSKHGRVHGECGGKTRVDIYNASLGVNYLYPFCNCFEAYAGLGGSLSRINLKNRSHCFHEEKSKLAGGLVLKSGIIYYFSCNWFLDLFVDYLYQPVKFHHHHCVDIGGVKAGGGIGVSF
jgi:hypothetical protein